MLVRGAGGHPKKCARRIPGGQVESPGRGRGRLGDRCSSVQSGVVVVTGARSLLSAVIGTFTRLAKSAECLAMVSRPCPRAS